MGNPIEGSTAAVKKPVADVKEAPEPKTGAAPTAKPAEGESSYQLQEKPALEIVNGNNATKADLFGEVDDAVGLSHDLPNGDIPDKIGKVMDELKQNKVFIWETSQRGYHLKRFWCVFYVDAKPGDLYQLFTDPANYAKWPEYMPLFTSSKLDGDFHSFTMHVPNGDQVTPKVKGLQAVVEVSKSRLGGRKGYHIGFEARPDKLPEKLEPDHVKITKETGIITIRKAPDGGSVVTYSVVAEPELTEGQWSSAQKIIEGETERAQTKLAHNIAERVKNPGFVQSDSDSLKYSPKKVSDPLE